MDNNFQCFSFASKLPLDAFSRWSKLPLGPEYGADITLRLDSSGTSGLYGSNSKGTKRKWDDINGIEIPAPSPLVLGLGWSSSSSDNSKMTSATVCTMSSAKETTDDESSADLGLNFELHLGSDYKFSQRKPSIASTKALGANARSDLELSLSIGPSKSVVTSITPVSALHQNRLGASVMIIPVPTVVEEGSMLGQWELGTHLLPSLYTSETTSSFALKEKFPAKSDLVPFIDLPSTTIPLLGSPVACTSEATHPRQQRNTGTKICQSEGCGKGARGASGLCISHGGGRRCQKSGCHKGAEGRTVYCKAHGGGRRCEHLGCTKSAEGRTDYCITHGGGRRCGHDSCARAARGKSGLCIRHGGGKRCQVEDCTKSAEGHSGLCISHGGGRRCRIPACTKGAQGSTTLCKAHGGGKRCTVLGCTKGAEGSTAFCKGHGGGKRCSFQGGDACTKSVHGGTQFCVAHGGGKRCAVPECTKSARGRTDFCVRHGGGKRCRSEGCGKSAQGSTDFCKAHGGGRRCSWVQGGSDLSAGDPPCDRFARGKTRLCAAHSALVQDLCVHGGGKLGPPAAQSSTPNEPKSLKEVSIEGDMVSNIGNGGEHLASWSGVDPMESLQSVTPLVSLLVSVPEGRVHGASLMAMLSSGAGGGSNSASQGEAGAAVQVMSNSTAHRWM